MNTHSAFIAIAAAWLFGACSFSSSSPKTDVAGLQELIRLPFPPIRAEYEVTSMGGGGCPAVPGPSDYTLQAIFEIDPSDVPRLLDGRKPSGHDGIQVEPRPWFPPEVRNALQDTGAPQSQLLPGTSFDAEPFGKLSFGSGEWTRLGNSNRFLLVMSTR